MSEAGEVAEGKSVDVGTSGRRDGSWLLSKCAGRQKRGNAGGDAETPWLRPETFGSVSCVVTAYICLVTREGLNFRRHLCQIY